jgi:hypothetical protein
MSDRFLFENPHNRFFPPGRCPARTRCAASAIGLSSVNLQENHMVAAVELTAAHALAGPQAALAQHLQQQPDSGLEGMQEAGVEVLASPTLADSIFHNTVNWAGEHWILASVAGAAALFAGHGVVKASLPSRTSKEQQALDIMNKDGRLAPIANLLSNAGGDSRALGIVRGSSYPAHTFFRGTPLRLEGTPAQQEAFFVELMSAVSGRPFNSVSEVNNAFDFTGSLPRGIPYMELKPQKGTNHSPIVRIRGENELATHGIMDAQRKGPEGINPPGYTFRYGYHHCVIRQVPGRDGNPVLTVQLRRSAPLTKDLEYKAPRFWATQKGPTGRVFPGAVNVVALPAQQEAAA